MSLEETLQTWAQGPSDSEQERCDNSVRMIVDALNEDDELAPLDIVVFPQGSYKARTNVKHDSDVDICITLKDTIFDEYPSDSIREMVGNSPSSYTFSMFKNSVERALVKKFGRSEVKRGNKAFDIHANSYRVDADVVPTFEYRQYTGQKNSLGQYSFHSGVKLITDNGSSIINWPTQTYDNGLVKHEETARMYKKVIRILKRTRNKMQEEGISSANNVASFLIESLVWNAPTRSFNRYSYTDTVRAVLAHTCDNTRDIRFCSEWGEVNEIKYLFRDTQPWTMEQANQFLNGAWNYLGYGA